MNNKLSYSDYKKIKQKFEDDKIYIPKGYYCYGLRVKSEYKDIEYSDDINFFDYYEKIVCPFWKDLGDGWVKCEHLNKSSNSDKGELFWDLVKDCSFLPYTDSDILIDNSFELISDEKLHMIDEMKKEL